MPTSASASTHLRLRLAAGRGAGRARRVAGRRAPEEALGHHAPPAGFRRRRTGRSGQQLPQRRERLGRDPVVRPAAALLALDEPGLEEHLQVVADGRLAQAERLRQVADARLALRLRLDQAEQAEPRRVGDGAQRRRGVAPLPRRAPAGGAEGTRRRSSRSAARKHIDTDRCRCHHRAVGGGGGLEGRSCFPPRVSSSPGAWPPRRSARSRSFSPAAARSWSTRRRTSSATSASRSRFGLVIMFGDLRRRPHQRRALQRRR